MSWITPARVHASRAFTVAAVAGITAVAVAGPAAAHVTAQPGTAERGSYSVITLRVPNESDTAGTVGLTVTVPTDRPITSVRTTPMPGWTATTTSVPVDPPVRHGERTITEAVSSVTFTADPGTRIAPGQYVDFPVSLGPLPEEGDELVLPATQTYDDGEVVAWDQPSTDGAEPERPAPVVELVAASGDGHGSHGGHGGSAEDPADAGTATVGAAAPGGQDTAARWLGGGGLLVGALGLGVGIGALLRGRATAGK